MRAEEVLGVIEDVAMLWPNAARLKALVMGRRGRNRHIVGVLDNWGGGDPCGHNTLVQGERIFF